ncbi:MAG: hypothetical protein MHM6MM_007420 [Cercozoa sp. M6MM]
MLTKLTATLSLTQAALAASPEQLSMWARRYTDGEPKPMEVDASTHRTYDPTDQIIASLQRETAHLSKELDESEKYMQRQIHELAHAAASLRHDTDVMIKRVAAMNGMTTTSTATTSTTTAAPACNSCTREGTLVTLSTACPEDVDGTVGTVCTCDNECDGDCSSMCMLTTDGGNQVLSENPNVCLGTNTVSAGGDCVCNSQCQQGYGCSMSTKKCTPLGVPCSGENSCDPGLTCTNAGVCRDSASVNQHGGSCSTEAYLSFECEIGLACADLGVTDNGFDSNTKYTPGSLTCLSQEGKTCTANLDCASGFCVNGATGLCGISSYSLLLADNSVELPCGGFNEACYGNGVCIENVCVFPSENDTCSTPGELLECDMGNNLSDPMRRVCESSSCTQLPA